MVLVLALDIWYWAYTLLMVLGIGRHSSVHLVLGTRVHADNSWAMVGMVTGQDSIPAPLYQSGICTYTLSFGLGGVPTSIVFNLPKKTECPTKTGWAKAYFNGTNFLEDKMAPPPRLQPRKWVVLWRLLSMIAADRGFYLEKNCAFISLCVPGSLTFDDKVLWVEKTLLDFERRVVDNCWKLLFCYRHHCWHVVVSTCATMWVSWPCAG